MRILLPVILLMAAMGAGVDQTPQTYQHGTVTGWTTRYYPSGFSGKHKFFELKGGGVVYQISDCGSFQAGQFTAGQAVDFRVDATDKNDKRIYIRREDGKEYKCKMQGARTADGAKAETPSATAPSTTP
ncbi:MAG: hypothetical protein WCA76_10340 [Candidatus Sulfotelmatobacter sp.]